MTTDSAQSTEDAHSTHSVEHKLPPMVMHAVKRAPISRQPYFQTQEGNSRPFPSMTVVKLWSTRRSPLHRTTSFRILD